MRFGAVLPSKKLLVLTSTWPLYPGDARSPFVSNLAFDLQDLGWTIDVLAPHAAGAKTTEIMSGAKVCRFRYAPEKYETAAYGAGGVVNYRNSRTKAMLVPFVAAEMAAVERAIVLNRPDIIHAHWILPQGFCAALPAQLHGIPLITTIHGSDVLALKAPIFRPFKALAGRLSAAVTVNSHVTHQAALDLGVAPRKLHTIPMPPGHAGTPSRESVAGIRKRYPEDAYLVSFVGRLIPEKGPDDFIKAIDLAGDKRIHGLVLGSGPMEAELRTLVNKLGLRERIDFLGWRSPEEVAGILAASDIFLGPCKTSPLGSAEAQGVVFLEAMKAGIPVIATDSGGISSIVRHENTGWLCQEGDFLTMSGYLLAGLSGALSPAVIAAGKRLATDEITRDATAKRFNHLFAEILGGAYK